MRRADAGDFTTDEEMQAVFDRTGTLPTHQDENPIYGPAKQHLIEIQDYIGKGYDSSHQPQSPSMSQIRNDYEHDIDQCSVDDKALLAAFREKRSEWID